MALVIGRLNGTTERARRAGRHGHGRRVPATPQLGGGLETLRAADLGYGGTWNDGWAYVCGPGALNA